MMGFFPPECYLPFPILRTHRTFSTYSRSVPCRFLYLPATMTGISRCERCFALRECVCERFAHGAISQWGPLKDESCEAIISFLCSVEPPGRVGSGHLIQSFSSTVVHCTMHQHKSHLPCRRRWKYCWWRQGSVASPPMCSTSGSIPIYLPSENICSV